MDTKRESRTVGIIGQTNFAAPGAAVRPVGFPAAGSRPSLRLVHSVPEPQADYLPRRAPAALELVAGAERYSQIIDLHRTGNSWEWDRRQHPAKEMRGHEAFDCKIWQRGASKPVLIAVLATGTGPAAQAESGVALAVSSLMNVLEQDIRGYLERGRLPTLLRGAVGEIQLMLELQAQHDKRPVSDYASSLLAAILTSDGGVIGRIGGGGALVQEDLEAWHPIRWLCQGGHAGETRRLTDADAFAGFQIAGFSSAPRRIRLFSGALEHTPAGDTCEIPA